MSDVLNTVSYDQFDDIPSLRNNAKVIFSEEAYNNLCSLMDNTKNRNMENGCYLVGRQAISENGSLYFYFDFCSSKFQTTDGNYRNGGVVPTDKSKEEVKNKLAEYRNFGISPCIMHFHTHNLNGIFESMSDQDYAVYTSMKYHFGDHKNFGMLAAPNISQGYNTSEISIVHSIDNMRIGSRCCAKFYSIPNIYYSKGNEIYKIGTFVKSTHHRITPNNERNRQDRYVQNLREWSGNSLVSGRGKNPVTNKEIKDENVGHIDINGFYCFQYENQTIEFPTVGYSMSSRFGR